AVKTIGSKRGRKKKGKPFYQQVWFQAVGIVLLLAVIIGVIWVATRPPSAETLYNRAKKLMDSSDPEKWSEAREGPLREYLRYYGNLDDKMTRDVKDAVLRVDAYEADELLRRLVKARRAEALAPKPDEERPWQGMGLDAALAEDAGDLARARDVWNGLRQKY